MYQVSERSLRRYWQNFESGKPFHIFLKTKDATVDIFIDSGGYATMRNKETSKYDLSLGGADIVLRRIKSGAPLPEAQQFFGAEEKATPMMLKPVAEYEVVAGPITGHVVVADSLMTQQVSQVENEPVAEELEPELKAEAEPSRSKRSLRRGTALDMMKECKRLKDEGKTNEEIRQILGFGHVSSVYDYLTKAKKAKL